MTHVLVVDDEPHLLRTLSLNLTGRGYRVTTASTGAAALQMTEALRPDLMVLDLGLPDIDGQAVIQRIRQRAQALPILVLSARHGSRDKVAALDLGANDYVTKPFDMNELVARLRAMSRHTQLAEPVPIVTLGPVTVDLAARLIRRSTPREAGDNDTSVIHLTPTEWRMLEVLLHRPGMLVTPAELLIAMRGGSEHTERSYLRIYLQQLRRKLEVDPARPRYLLTEPGLGYRYQP